MNKSVNIISNSTVFSRVIKDNLIKKLKLAGFTVNDTFKTDADLIISIGGDGIFLNLVQEYNFPSIPIVGINTGHLGFFQDINPDEIDHFIEIYKSGNYEIQTLSMLEAKVVTGNGTFYHKGMNEIVIRGAHTSHATHLNIAIGDSFIENFSGDGVVISTPAGSTAYTYSLHGSIVDPRIKAIQVTPIAPMNNTAYRSFTSSLLLPIDIPIRIKPENTLHSRSLYINNDARQTVYDNVDEIHIDIAKDAVSLIRLDNYDFWHKVMTKFL